MIIITKIDARFERNVAGCIKLFEDFNLQLATCTLHLFPIKFPTFASHRILIMIRSEETICALATAIGGAIAVIKISGPQSLVICEKIFYPSGSNINISGQKGYTVVFGEIRSGVQVIDEVLLTIFRTPHSYTGEN